jgi:hypothetical protein
MNSSSLRRAVSRTLLPLVLVAMGTLPALPAFADGARVGVGRRKAIVETEHFGDFYKPQIVSSGRNVYAFWQPKELTASDRMVAVSSDGGKLFSTPRRVRIPNIFRPLTAAGDSAGNVYFVGTTAFDDQLSIVRADSRLKTFTGPTFVDGGATVTRASLAVATDGRIFLAWETSFSVRLPGGVSTTANQVGWALSTDGGISFGEAAITNARPQTESDFAPTFATGSDGAVWLFHVRDTTPDRVAAGPGNYFGGRILAVRVDGVASSPIDIPRAATLDGGPLLIRAAVADDGSLRVAWAERSGINSATVERVFFVRFDPASAPAAPAGPIAQVGSPREFYMARTAAGKIIVVLHGAGLDSHADEPAIIARASADDGQTFGALHQVTEYPPITSVDVTTDGRRVYSLWTDTRIVQFAVLSAKAPR